MVAGAAFALFALFVVEASAEAADLTAGLRAGADFRAAVFVVVVRVGIIWKMFHGLREATLLCGCFSRDRVVDFLRFRFIHAQNVDEIGDVGILQSFEVCKS